MHNTQALLSTRIFLATSQTPYGTVPLSWYTQVEYTYITNLDVKSDHACEHLEGPSHHSVWKAVEPLEDEALLEKWVAGSRGNEVLVLAYDAREPGMSNTQGCFFSCRDG